MFKETFEVVEGDDGDPRAAVFGPELDSHPLTGIWGEDVHE